MRPPALSGIPPGIRGAPNVCPNTGRIPAGGAPITDAPAGIPAITGIMPGATRGRPTS